MTLRRIIDFIKSHEKQLVLFNVAATDPIAENLTAYFDTRNVRIRTERTTSGAPEVAVLSNDAAVLTTVSVSTLRDLVKTVPDHSGATRVNDGESDTLLGHLRETTFTSYDTEQLLYSSREIEDRARRVGGGTIYAGFQRISVVSDQQSIYTDLGQHGVEVHAFGLPDASPPDLGSGWVHPVETDEIAESWFVVFDGGTDDTQKSALLASEYASDAYYGAWTYDPGIVDDTLAYLEERYLPPIDGMPSSTTE
jgi:hypothetical protein